MSAVTKSARVCETCGSPIDTTSAGDLGCIACLIGTGLDAEAEQSDTTFTSAPDQLGAYSIEHHVDGSAWELGRGAMGVTYRAIDKPLDRHVAKIINTLARTAPKRSRAARSSGVATPKCGDHTFPVREKPPIFTRWSWSKAKRSKSAFAAWDRSMFSQRSTLPCK
jgi:hypothetical protein